ncbi:hypothetical protein CA11_27000 [Gimesia maris]|nr:hypothetical protein CA11_27000 [Gimesia maris]
MMQKNNSLLFSVELHSESVSFVLAAVREVIFREQT